MRLRKYTFRKVRPGQKRRKQDVELRFMKFVRYSLTTTCWLWAGSKNKGGYGQFSYNGRCCIASRISYSIFVAPLIHGFEVDHLCQNTSCVNPDHLQQVIPEVNKERKTLFMKPLVVKSEKVIQDVLTKPTPVHDNYLLPEISYSLLSSANSYTEVHQHG